MKLIFAVVHDEDAKSAVKELNKNEFGVTKLSSSGGFLRKDNCTLMIGTDDDKIGAVMDILKQTCAKREEIEIITPYLNEGMHHVSKYTYTPIKVEAGGAIVFVVDVAEFWKI